MQLELHNLFPILFCPEKMSGVRVIQMLLKSVELALAILWHLDASYMHFLSLETTIKYIK